MEWKYENDVCFIAKKLKKIFSQFNRRCWVDVFRFSSSKSLLMIKNSTDQIVCSNSYAQIVNSNLMSLFRIYRLVVEESCSFNMQLCQQFEEVVILEKFYFWWDNFLTLWHYNLLYFLQLNRRVRQFFHINFCFWNNLQFNLKFDWKFNFKHSLKLFPTHTTVDVLLFINLFPIFLHLFTFAFYSIIFEFLTDV